MKYTYENYIGKRSERLVLLAPAINPNKAKNNRHRYGMFLCDCGNQKILRISHVFITGLDQIKSCGCLRKENNYKIIKRKLPDNEAAKRQTMQRYKHSKPELLFDLTNEQMEFLFQSNCFYCGINPSYTSIYSYHKSEGKITPNSCYTYNGIDRVDNTLGYTVSNCVTCCIHCNFAKRTRTFEEFKNWVKMAYDNLFAGQKGT